MKTTIRKHLMTGLVLAAVLTLSACGKKTALVRISDVGAETEIEVGLPEKVSSILDQAAITLSEGDVTEPAADETMSEAGTIRVLRRVTVSLVQDGESREVTVTGQTVADLLAAEDIVLAEGQRVSPAASAWLEEGMEVVIASSSTVAVTVDGKTTEQETEAETVETFLEEAKVTLGEDDRTEPALSASLKGVSEVVVYRVVIEEETETETIPFDTERRETDALDKGTERLETEGRAGERVTTWKITIVDGEEESREKAGEEITVEPQNEVILVGTKEPETAPAPAAASNPAPASEPEPTPAPAVDPAPAPEPEPTPAPEPEPEPAPAQPYEVSRTPFPNCDDESHGYYEIIWSDGSATYEEY